VNDDPFNLLTEPWIPVRPTGTTSMRLVGLREAITQAREFTGIEDASPLQTVALYRLLLAVLHRALMGPKDSGDVAKWWKDGFPEEALKVYFQAHGARFELFGEQPFMQVADLPLEGFKQSWTWLSADTGRANTLAVFNLTKRHGYVQPSISSDEIARRLIELQAFAIGGLTRKFTTSASGAPSATTALIMARGNTLHETLCLNLVPYTQNVERDIPPWEGNSSTVQQIQRFYSGKEN